MNVFRVAHIGIPDEKGHPVGPYNMGRPFNYDTLSAFEQNGQYFEDYHELTESIYSMLEVDWPGHRPTPMSDGLGWLDEGVEYSGFSSVGSLLAWFDSEDRRVLADEGFSILTYEAPMDALRFGSCQVAVRLDECELVKIDDLY